MFLYEGKADQIILANNKKKNNFHGHWILVANNLSKALPPFPLISITLISPAQSRRASK